tara:strand:+ start:3194 stop:3679 length:486 start_codon:yes stop_codon:yes gene_type:complete
MQIENPRVREAKLNDALLLHKNLRKDDIREIRASDNVSPLEALVLPFTYEGSQTYSIIHDVEDDIIGMFGVCPAINDDTFGVAWMLATDNIQVIGKTFLKESRYWVNEMGKPYDFLYNFIDKRNWKSLKWLQFCGFEPKQELNYGHEQRKFLLVMKDMKDV